LLVDQENITAILDILAPTFVRELCATLGHTWYYRRFIHSYVKVVPLEKLLLKDTNYIWNLECQETLETMKDKLVMTPILMFPDWVNIFHVHVDSSSIVLGTMLTQPRKNHIDHTVYFSNRKISDSEKNYMTTKHEGLVMIYALQKFKHYLLRTPFNFFTSHSMLKYVVNNLVLVGRICIWILIFQ
jgi:hypothetical protein